MLTFKKDIKMDLSETDTINEIPCNNGLVGIYVQENDSNRRKAIQSWTEEETKYLMQLYEENVKKVGLSRRFRIKRMMWIHVAELMTEKYGREFTDAQVENRYKNEKRKKKIRSSSSEHKIQMDDCVSPEVEIMRGRTRMVKKTENLSDDYYNSNHVPPCEPSPPFLFEESKEHIILKYMEQQREIFKEKEIRKQKRHDEKMTVLKGIGESLQRLLERKKKYNS